ncbi:MAG: hypothetical protein AB8G77_21025 [Rhodothermales bacterium]
MQHLLVAFFSIFASNALSAEETNWGEITLEAGKSGTCMSSPCKVNFVTPPGKSNYEVLADDVKVGSFSAGQTVTLGGFWTGFTTFTIVGSDVGPTKLNVVGRN